ncbi:hypothetical protein GCM10007049_05210 [Echinicola pacifica]|uniref:HmuY protein n=1 Tax=Echinicola pacifica TaxID=346377 RepID=A0A918PNA4_9BACT|nr:HmuY family protein [Echinicola pacifica]GGZ15938.1 hypothetical protein GCM10007049_05210 [Echinicola pacifica]
MKKVNFIALLLMALPVFVACTSDDDTEPMVEEELEIVLVEDLHAAGAHSGGTDTIYYSLENNAIVPNKEGDWDLGFFGTSIFTSGGVYGSGSAQAAVIEETVFEELKEIPTSLVLAVDTKEGLAIPTGMGNGWYNYDMTSHFITPIAGRVIVVKTNAGNYAKMDILSFFKGNPTTSEMALENMYYFTFRYVLQPNGTKTF